MVKKKKSILPIILGVGALFLLARPVGAEPLFGGGGGTGGLLPALFSQPVDTIGTSPTQPSFSFPSFSFPTDDTQLSQTRLPTPSKKLSRTLSTGGASLVDLGNPNVTPFTLKVPVSQLNLGVSNVSGFTSSGGGGGGSSKKTIRSGNLVSIGNPNTRFTGSSSLKNKKQAKESETRATSLFKRIRGN